VKVKAVTPSALVGSLVSQGVFADFCGSWTRSHKFEGFTPSLGDQVYQDFVRYVGDQAKSKNLRLDEALPALQTLQEQLETSKLEISTKRLSDLKAAVNEELQGQLKKEERELKLILQDAIAARYIPDSMLQKHALESDEQFQKALEIIQSPTLYKKILAGDKV